MLRNMIGLRWEISLASKTDQSLNSLYALRVSWSWIILSVDISWSERKQHARKTRLYVGELPPAFSRGLWLAVASLNHLHQLFRPEPLSCSIFVHVNFNMSSGTWEVWPDGDKVPRTVSGISDESSDGDRAETENAGECNLLLDIPDQVQS